MSSQEGSKIQKTSTKLTQDDNNSSFRIRGSKPPTPSQNPHQPRIPTIYGMPKLQAKTLPKLDHQLAANMSTSTDQSDTSGIKLDATLKPMLKKGYNAEVESPKKHMDDKYEEEKLSHSKSRISTAKSTQSNSSMQSLSLTASQANLLFDPNSIVDDNSVLGQLVKTNLTLLQKCLVSSNKAIFIAAIENLKNASNNFGPALNKHLPIALQLVKKKQDLVATERIHDLKAVLIMNGGEDAEKIVESIGLK